MEFIDLVQSISQKFKLSSFKDTANSLLDLVSQYPGGVSENIVESHFVRCWKLTLLPGFQILKLILDRLY